MISSIINVLTFGALRRLTLAHHVRQNFDAVFSALPAGEQERIICASGYEA
jgi:hypothetical protein